jgi:5-methylcytosine-specific restriction endonuclease McrA
VPEALVLNATFEPIGVVSQRRAVVLVLSDKAVLVECGDGALHSERTVIEIPLVVRLTRFVRVPYRAWVPLTRRGVLLRDGGRCVYCNAAATSLDHVVPRSRGGEHSWENVVACCARCNRQKAARSLAELGWHLRRPPASPKGLAWAILGARRVDPSWTPYLGDAAAQATA